MIAIRYFSKWQSVFFPWPLKKEKHICPNAFLLFLFFSSCFHSFT
ncbi:hypothetical protein HMPREF3213_01443 [Heyndrickxia coagulans]|uniref:Uncharacterized protein n=1 Tax=Heyndrickxia coagulans TaxID=1398 RepID=A0A133KTP9_HEYCO|nr:hypothetical protein HMPREF3213_01443 [Heyndrickxia coagulans]